MIQALNMLYELLSDMSLNTMLYKAFRASLMGSQCGCTSTTPRITPLYNAFVQHLQVFGGNQIDLRSWHRSDCWQRHDQSGKLIFHISFYDFLVKQFCPVT